MQLPLSPAVWWYICLRAVLWYICLQASPCYIVNLLGDKYLTTAAVGSIDSKP
jgi:hypothetical protein